MQATKVKCVVSTCTHWLEGNHCNASNIDILHEEENKMSQNAEQTQCKTFNQRRGLANMLGSLDNINWSGVLSKSLLLSEETNPTVTCLVHSCVHWYEGNRCRAASIDVVGDNADESQDTNCYTFQMKQ